MDTGISAKDRSTIAGGLSRLLADTYILYLKTHNFHWNVEGPRFRGLHMMFEEQLRARSAAQFRRLRPRVTKQPRVSLSTA